MNNTFKDLLIAGICFFFILLAGSSYAATYQVPEDAVIDVDGNVYLDSQGSSSNPAEWILGGDYSASSNFTVGQPADQYNWLTIAGSETLNISGKMQIGQASIMHYGRFNRVDINGRLNIGEELDLSNGFNATNNTINIGTGGIVVSGSFSLYNHWTYGNSWLELNGGVLAISGDNEAIFDEGEGILTSIKIWDQIAGEYARVAQYSGQSVLMNQEAFNLLSVDYLAGAQMATDLGFSNDFVGYTVVRQSPVPVPGSAILFGTGLLILVRYGRKKSE